MLWHVTTVKYNADKLHTKVIIVGRRPWHTNKFTRCHWLVGRHSHLTCLNISTCTFCNSESEHEQFNVSCYQGLLVGVLNTGCLQYIHACNSAIGTVHDKNVICSHNQYVHSDGPDVAMEMPVE